MQAFVLTVVLVLAPIAAVVAAELPIFDAHLHYSHDTRDVLPAKTAAEILRKSGVQQAYMHNGQLAALPDVVRYYSEINPLLLRMPMTDNTGGC